MIIEAAHRLIRYDPRWKALAASMRQAGKPGVRDRRGGRQPLGPLAVPSSRGRPDHVEESGLITEQATIECGTLTGRRITAASRAEGDDSTHPWA